ncbi:hypothetical protein ACHAWU_008683 [Discostella pseudostelligera]|uniref:Carbohydrate kinase FGGY C-terminal domain-containing protein n=1 Tax=Discostella pseudostelligera TaxID=259834 RepID=A0ABD3M8U3_9STRA
MNSLTSPGYLIIGMTLLASLVVIVSIAEAFSFSTPARTSAAEKFTPSPPQFYSTTATITTKVSMPPHHHSLVAFGSLRDLVESSSGNNDDNKKDGASSNSSNNNGADNFNNLLNFSRSKFAETKSLRSRENSSRPGWSSSGRGGDDVDDERGLHEDRLSTFSFATNAPKSQSQGGAGASTDIEYSPDVNDEDIIDRTTIEETSTSVARRENKNAMSEDYAADNFNSMVGTFYSKQKFPSRDKGKISDDMDERGLHSDRLSTFSFSSPNTFSFATRSPKSQSEGSSSSVEEGYMVDNSTNDEEDDVDTVVGGNSSFRGAAINDDTMLADNFNSMVGTFYSKQKFPSREKGKVSDDMDELGLHSDRLSTFSFSSSQPKVKTPLVDDAGAVSDEALSGRLDDQSFSITSKSITSPINRLSSTTSTNEDGSSSTESPSLFNPVNHNDRLGTFSFASTDPHSGSTSIKGTSASSPLASSSDSKTTPPQSRPKESKDSDRVLYTSPQKGSLSSIASSVYIKSRNDRIKDIKDATDPKLLHPDGMNIPRLNSKGDVMTLSSTDGRLNIFQRIGNVKQIKDESDDGTSTADGDKNDGRGDCFIGFDLGTSGARMSIVEKRMSSSSSGDEKKLKYVEVVTESLTWNDEMRYDDANDWRAAIDALLARVRGNEIMTRVKSICVSGTSASCLLLNKNSLDVARPARMYNYDILSSSDSSDEDSPARRVMKLIDQYVPEKHTARATTGSLAKLLLWNEVKPLVNAKGDVEEVFCHQSDYISMALMWEGVDNDDKKCKVFSDWHNCLKLGYDVRRLEFPLWMHELLKEGADIPHPESVLPSKVISPGEPFGVISPVVASTYGLSSNVVIVGGTTDSNAAFFASAGTKPDFGTSVTSLGSTLAIKQLSKTFVEDASRGVYSHRFPIFGNSDDDEKVDDEAWLIGGASNVGCAILRQEGFSNDELRTLSEEIDPNSDSSYAYYPLTKKGERFPVADSTKEPVLSPRSDSRKDYLHGILQGIGDVEREGYRVLGELGADPSMPTIVLTAGGGSANSMWMTLRERRLRNICGAAVEVRRATNTEASYGAALLAAASFENTASPASSENYGTQENYIN